MYTHTQVQNTAYTTLTDDQQRTGWGKLSQWKPAILFYYINLFVVCVCVCVCITLLHILGLIYQSKVETSADSSAQISSRQGSRVIHQTFVCCQPHRTNE